MRVTQDTRSALEAQAAREGRSVSQVAERLLDQALTGQADLQRMLGGVEVSGVIMAMTDLARAIEERLGSPAKDPLARDALISGWRALIDRALPLVPVTAQEEELVDLREEARLACRAAIRSLADVDAPVDWMVSARAQLTPLVYSDELQSPNDRLVRFLREHEEVEPIKAAANRLDAYYRALWAYIEERANASQIGSDMAGAMDVRRALTLRRAVEATVKVRADTKALGG